MKRLPRAIVFLFVTAIAQCLAAPACPAEKPSAQTDWGKTVQAAKQEGQILIYAAMGPYHPQIFAEFQKDFPEIKATVVHGNGNRISPRLIAERRAGRLDRTAAC